MKLELGEKVDGQLADLAAHIAVDNPDAARRFLESVYVEFDFLLDWPEASPLARLHSRRLKGVRYRPVRRPFQNYLIFYRVRGDVLFVGAVLWGGTNWTEDLSLF